MTKWEKQVNTVDREANKYGELITKWENNKPNTLSWLDSCHSEDIQLCLLKEFEFLLLPKSKLLLLHEIIFQLTLILDLMQCGWRRAASGERRATEEPLTSWWRHCTFFVASPSTPLFNVVCAHAERRPCARRGRRVVLPQPYSIWTQLRRAASPKQAFVTELDTLHTFWKMALKTPFKTLFFSCNIIWHFYGIILISYLSKKCNSVLSKIVSYQFQYLYHSSPQNKLGTSTRVPRRPWFVILAIILLILK